MTKFQIYSHFKLPITRDPLKYGKLLDQINNKFIIALSTKNIAIINHYEKENFIRIFKNGDLVLEFKDKFINENSFIRTINDTKFLFENDKLVSTQILNVSGQYIIYEDTNAIQINPLYKFSIIFILILFVIFPENNETNISLAASSIFNIIKLRKVQAKHIWKDVNFKINNKIFSKILFEKLFYQFWNKIENEFTNDNHMFILFKIKYNYGDFTSVGKVQRINKSDYSWYIDFIMENMKFKSEYYNETQIESIVFSYGFKNGKINNKESIPINKVNLQNYKDNNLPISMNPMNYGRLINENILENKILYILQNDKGQTITFNKFDNYNEVEFFKSGIALVKFKDIFINENKFMRIIDNKKFYFENGKQILFQTEMKTEFIAKTEKTRNLSNNFITVDIETYIDEYTLIPFLISFYDGKKSYSFGLWNYENVEQMILDCLNSILIRKYNGYKIYVHNLAKFDIIFLFKYLVKVGKIKPIIHNGKFISVTVGYGDNNQYQIKFKDSMLLLLYSLESLCTSFGIDEGKSIFPHLFVSENNLGYKGDVPGIKDFIEITEKEYKNYIQNFKKVSNIWNMKSEAIKYCKIDCTSLYKIIYKFNSIIFKLFSLNIHHHPTLSSLAFNIFRSNFMKDINIPKLSEKIVSDIRQGYTGGAVDMYIPESESGVEIKCFDVNSLYPSQMQSQLMPVGNPTYFEGDIRKIKSNTFGFFFCEIIAPEDILHPIIQTRVKINGVTKTIAPVGCWEDMLFSEELYNAEKYGYKFNILWGYTFDSENIFKEYVDFLYNLRSQYPKTDPMNIITKILMNSLYGRFGMNDIFENIEILTKEYYPDFENKYIDQITDKIDLGDHILVFYISPEKEDSDTSVVIAAATTAYSRIHMSQFKNNPNIRLYYTDTDSIYTDSDIHESFVNNKTLGKLKLENVCKRAIFLAAKLYCLETNSNKIITKVKGLKNTSTLTYNDFENLLNKNFILEKSHEKWFRHLTESNISILEQIYSIKVTENKRELIYNENNKLISTKSYKIDKSKNIK